MSEFDELVIQFNRNKSIKAEKHERSTIAASSAVLSNNVQSFANEMADDFFLAFNSTVEIIIQGHAEGKNIDEYIDSFALSRNFGSETEDQMRFSAATIAAARKVYKKYFKELPAPTKQKLFTALHAQGRLAEFIAPVEDGHDMFPQSLKKEIQKFLANQKPDDEPADLEGIEQMRANYARLKLKFMMIGTLSPITLIKNHPEQFSLAEDYRIFLNLPFAILTEALQIDDSIEIDLAPDVKRLADHLTSSQNNTDLAREITAEMWKVFEKGDAMRSLFEVLDEYGHLEDIFERSRILPAAVVGKIKDFFEQKEYEKTKTSVPEAELNDRIQIVPADETIETKPDVTRWSEETLADIADFLCRRYGLTKKSIRVKDKDGELYAESSEDGEFILGAVQGSEEFKLIIAPLLEKRIRHLDIDISENKEKLFEKVKRLESLREALDRLQIERETVIQTFQDIVKLSKANTDPSEKTRLIREGDQKIVESHNVSEKIVKTLIELILAHDEEGLTTSQDRFHLLRDRIRYNWQASGFDKFKKSMTRIFGEWRSNDIARLFTVLDKYDSLIPILYDGQVTAKHGKVYFEPLVYDPVVSGNIETTHAYYNSIGAVELERGNYAYVSKKLAKYANPALPTKIWNAWHEWKKHNGPGLEEAARERDQLNKVIEAGLDSLANPPEKSVLFTKILPGGMAMMVNRKEFDENPAMVFIKLREKDFSAAQRQFMADWIDETFKSLDDKGKDLFLSTLQDSDQVHTFRRLRLLSPDLLSACDQWLKASHNAATRIESPAENQPELLDLAKFHIKTFISPISEYRLTRLTPDFFKAAENSEGPETGLTPCLDFNMAYGCYEFPKKDSWFELIGHDKLLPEGDAEHFGEWAGKKREYSDSQDEPETQPRFLWLANYLAASGYARDDIKIHHMKRLGAGIKRHTNIIIDVKKQDEHFQIALCLKLDENLLENLENPDNWGRAESEQGHSTYIIRNPLDLTLEESEEITIAHLKTRHQDVFRVYCYTQAQYLKKIDHDIVTPLEDMAPQIKTPMFWGGPNTAEKVLETTLAFYNELGRMFLTIDDNIIEYGPLKGMSHYSRMYRAVLNGSVFGLDHIRGKKDLLDAALAYSERKIALVKEPEAQVMEARYIFNEAAMHAAVYEVCLTAQDRPDIEATLTQGKVTGWEKIGITTPVHSIRDFNLASELASNDNEEKVRSLFLTRQIAAGLGLEF